MAKSLDQLRAELGKVDGELLSLLAERQRLSGEVGAAKRAIGRPTRDYAQERNVISKARKRAEDMGLAPDIAEELMLLLIRSSLTLQEKDRVEAAGTGSGKRVLIIGGAGKMGMWMVRFLRSQGYAVQVADPAAESTDEGTIRDYKDSPLDHDIIVVAAPLKASATILEDLAQRRPSGLVFDIGSLKSPLRPALRTLAASGAKVTSVHPMFGPDTDLLSGRHVIFVDVGNADAVAEAKDLFAATMAKQVDMDLESHDRLIAYVLGLAHALNIAFFTALAESGEKAPRLAQLSSTTFDAQLSIASNVARENPGLYFEIQHLNDYGSESLSALLYAVERLRSVIRAGDEQEFRKLMDKGLSYLAGRPSPAESPP